jgi:hypothetical protein
MLAVLFAAFSRSYFLRAALGTPDIGGAPGLPLHLHVHGLMLTSWFVLFLVQAHLSALRVCACIAPWASLESFSR